MNFLELISGWASDGMQVPPQLLEMMLNNAKQTENGKKTVESIVSGGH